MKLTKSQLREIIREEINTLNESTYGRSGRTTDKLDSAALKAYNAATTMIAKNKDDKGNKVFTPNNNGGSLWVKDFVNSHSLSKGLSSSMKSHLEKALHNYRFNIIRQEY